MRFMVFDLPMHGGPFDERLQALQTLVTHINQAWVQAVPQTPATTHVALMAQLRQTEREGGEGLMLHHGSAHYRAGRSHDLLKVKSHDDAEALVVGHIPGKGRLAGQTGALLVRMPTGQRFKLGAGLSDQNRKAPPPVGTWVTYRYRGLHPSGVPRFASFIRVRTEPF
jgi:DNA ligase-1